MGVRVAVRHGVARMRALNAAGASHRRKTIASQNQSVPHEHLPSTCPGCGVKLQQANPDAPGYFVLPKSYQQNDTASTGSTDDIAYEEDEQSVDSEGVRDVTADGTNVSEGGSRLIGTVRAHERQAAVSAFDAAASAVRAHSSPDERDDAIKAALSADSAASDEDDWRVPSSFRLDAPADTAAQYIVCQRCYALQHYGQLKSEEAERALPAFDFERVVGERIAQSTWSRKPVIAVVIDAADVEGSIPASALQFLQKKKAEKVDFVVALTKCDLLPKHLPEKRLLQWFQSRLAKSGLTLIGKGSLHIVSGAKGNGMRSFARALEHKCGHKGEAWFVGAQNAGKSSVIKCLRELYRREEQSSTKRKANSTPAPSVSHVPGTTLGLVRLDSLLPGNRAAVDTPGLLQAHQLITRLTPAEAKMVLPRKPLMPKTYRLPVGNSLHIGALARLDVEALPGRTAYFTLWASDDIMTHMGKTSKANEVLSKHAGDKLQPPMSAERVEELGRLQRKRLSMEGSSWKYQSVDICIAGLGWISVGCEGDAVVSVWAPEGVLVNTRPALLWDCARDFEKPGFADENTNKRKQLLGPRKAKPKRRTDAAKSGKR